MNKQIENHILKNYFKKCIFILFFYILIFRGDFLTNINCSLNCIYQKDGKCGYSNITLNKFYWSDALFSRFRAEASYNRRTTVLKRRHNRTEL